MDPQNLSVDHSVWIRNRNARAIEKSHTLWKNFKRIFPEKFIKKDGAESTGAILSFFDPLISKGSTSFKVAINTPLDAEKYTYFGNGKIIQCFKADHVSSHQGKKLGKDFEFPGGGFYFKDFVTFPHGISLSGLRSEDDSLFSLTLEVILGYMDYEIAIEIAELHCPRTVQENLITLHKRGMI